MRPATEPSTPIALPTSTLDLLRHRERIFDHISTGEDLGQATRHCLLAALAGALTLGLALGTYTQSWAQLLASALKLPILLLGTATLCFPAFHVLQSWRAPHPLGLRQALALQATSLAAVAIIWGSLAPPLVFLVASTRHYRLTQFLAVGVGAFGGVVGLSVLLAGYRALCVREASGSPFRLLFPFFVVFGTVGSQLAWVLRPFVGSPSLPFQLVRAADPEAGNFFTFLLHMIFG